MSYRSDRPIDRAIDDAFELVRWASILWVLFLGLVAVIMIFSVLGDVFRYGLTWGEFWGLVQVGFWVAVGVSFWLWRRSRRRAEDARWLVGARADDDDQDVDQAPGRCQEHEGCGCNWGR